ncbi:thermonuclease family protein (plasmid) [Sphingomonas changnyeongensis]|uniref:Thermonuclease family protein n=1 Tax=Sphingomonas changnyeongensis TaxID=2698679 RepID=A0A7Z2NZ37_9SPHN|nr:thermonuclease family protein [Sphingomonas changnyeongensis]QHL92057.1 thermonuclease family protein [Sphingomonas changnyeongensis]
MLVTLAAMALCIVTDGDSLRCGAERIRIAGIDAPEIRRCPRHRTCTPGDGRASKRALEALTAGRALRVERVGRDRYGRTLAKVYVGRLNIACAMMARGYAVPRYEARWTRECR